MQFIWKTRCVMIVNRSEAQQLLKALCELRISDIPNSCQMNVRQVCIQLCRIADDGDLNTLVYLSKCYPFFEDEFTYKRIKEVVQNKPEICTDTDKMLDIAVQFCTAVYRQSFVSILARDILGTVLRHLPFRIALRVFTDIYKVNAQTSSEDEIQTVMYGSIQTQIEKSLVFYQKTCNLQALWDSWKLFEKAEFLKRKFQAKYEDAILKIFEFDGKADESFQTIVLESIERFAFFIDPAKQEKLIWKLVKSKQQILNKLFLVIARHPEIKEKLALFGKKQVYELCFCFATNSDVYVTREKRLTFVCERLGDLWLLPQMEITMFKEVWEDVLTCEFQKYRLREIYQTLRLLDRLCQRTSQIEEVLLKYVRVTLRSKNESMQPGDIFCWLGGNVNRPKVENMLSVKILEMIMESVLPRSSDKDLDQYLCLVERHLFWKSVYACEGPYAEMIMKSQYFEKAKRCVKTMVSSFQNHNVSYDCVVDIESNAKNCRIFKELLKLECKSDEIERLWNEALMKFKEEKDKLQRCQRVLTSAVSRLGSGHLKEALHSLQKRIEYAEEILTSGKLTARDCLRKNMIWKEIERLPFLCECLEGFMPSDVFWNLSLDSVMEEFKSAADHVSDPMDSLEGLCLLFKECKVTGEEDTSAIVLTFLNILSKTGISIYRETWKQLIENDSFHMDDVRKMFGKKPDLKLEIKLARKLLLFEIAEYIEITLERVYAIDKVKATVNAVVSVFSAFRLELSEQFSSAVESFEELKKGAASEFTFIDVKQVLETIFRSVEGLSEDTIDIMIELGRSASLIRFLQNIVDEDIRNLIDAVEDISEQQVRESTVSALIEVKRYVQPLLIPQTGRTYQDLIRMLETQTKTVQGNAKSLPAKIADCMSHLHNLKSLYNNVANRGEQTKEMIKNIIYRGTFSFKLDSDSGPVIFEVVYKQNKNREIRQKTTLIDLRSRAFLLKNTERKESESQFSQDELAKFIDYIDLCLDIADSLFELYSSGNFEYMKVHSSVKPNELQKKKDDLYSELCEWNETLTVARKTYFLLNFVQGTQIHMLYRYLEGIDSDAVAVLTMLRFIHPDLQIENMKDVYTKEKHKQDIYNEQSKLNSIGFSLHASFEGLCLYERQIANDVSGMPTKITGKVKTSRLLVAQLEEGSIHTVKTVIALYLNTTQRLPEPNQLLFCTRYTTWGEIDLHIRRCLGAESFYKSTPLFCIANVERLPNEIQFALVDMLRNLDRKQKYLLALVCRGSRNHPFIDELGEFVTSVSPASDKRVKTIFLAHCNEVLTITSDKAGQGKSSLIQRYAHENGKGVIKLHVSGPVRKLTLVERLISLKIKKNNLLHIDIGTVDDPTELDTFLFELIVLRHVSAGRLSFSLGTKDVKIEIGNTINDSLRNSLQTAVLFRREHVDWRGINAMLVSKEPQSSIQVVCKYLKALENGLLDKIDVQISTENAPLSRAQCMSLMCKYVGEDFCDSFPVLKTFLEVLADQLKKLGQSSFFKVSRLRDMVGSKSPIAVKSKLVNALLEMSKEFAKRSVADCRASQMSTLTSSTDQEPVEFETRHSLASIIVERIRGMIRWEDSNHLLFVFHNQNIQTLSALYRNLNNVSADVKFLFESQMKKKMEDFTSMDQRALQNILQKVARSNPLPLQEEKLETLAKEYALTADNLLKMVLIMLRVRSNIPVVVMGETGCGKTSLVRYLASICEVSFDVVNIHAGITDEDIIDKVMRCNDKALQSLDDEFWLFLDEINTSESIGVIGDILCHHTCLGKDLSPNLVVMAACNPYRLRTSKAISTAGLDSKVKTDELSKLVYRVLPLPETLVDFVWDFGTLSEKDEEKYIYRMTDDVFENDEEHHILFACLLSASQAFVRKKECSSYSVSLRDVQRCKILTKWFMYTLLRKEMLHKKSEWDCDIRLKSIILSLAHCYHSRFGDKQLRQEYRSVLADVFMLHECVPNKPSYDDFFLGILKAEQSDILDRMVLPPGTACNSALQENVFVILVCIFNRIPIFVVGKPGCSKSLAMQLIRSNLRGKDSKDAFFRTLPQLYCVSFQGSESSTSDGIMKVFEKAENYQQSNSREDVLSVVILDEIGLAEISRFNPLKVLHNLLEPDGKSQPNVAVVGISNWALDASKMNRAIHLSRTDMDTEELYETAISISRSFLESEKPETLFDNDETEISISTKDIESELHGMADSYTRYIKQMRFKNFHGLRDYYSLVKYVARMFAEKGSGLEEAEKADLILLGLERNFGGLPAERQTLHDVFRKCMPVVPSSQNSVIDLITQNVKDPIARHMMLITTGESVLGVVEQKLSEIGCSRKEVIYGSQFEEDLTDDYNYRILSRIILCMEEGIVLILKDLESVYGSLYDMLNQNYTVIGKKKNCRVALGAYSNPICYVADSFRCIVLIEENKLDLSDPPFLNRFEKQYLRFSDIIGETERNMINEIEKWIDDLANFERPSIKKEDMFPMYNADMVASLVLKHILDKTEVLHRKSKDITQIIDDCLKDLLWVIKPEVVVQLGASPKFYSEHLSAHSISEYFVLPVHDGFDTFLNYQIHLTESSENLMCIVFTNSNVHTKVSEITTEALQVEKLGAFKSEKQLSSRIQHFWEREDCSILVVQCNAKDDEKHIMLTKLVIERHRQEYLLRTNSQIRKHVYLIIHLDRTKGESSCLPQLNFLCQWQLVMLDSIEKPSIPLPVLCRLTLLEAVEQRRPLKNCLRDELFWAFTRIKYGSQSRDVESLSHIIETIENSEDFLEVLDNEVWEWIRNHISAEENMNWQRKVAKDKTLLNTSTGLVDALEHFILNTIKLPLCKFIYKIELNGIADSFFDTTVTDGKENYDVTKQRRKIWLSLLHDRSVFCIDDIPDESGPECYSCDTMHTGLRMPFSRFLFDGIETTRDDFLEVVRTYKVHCLLCEEDDLPKEIYEEVLSQQESFILQKLPELNRFLYKNWKFDYLEDFCNIVSLRICPSMPKLERVKYAKLIVRQFCDISCDDPFTFVSHIHTACWVNHKSMRAELLLIEASLLVVPDIGHEIEKILLPMNQTFLEEGTFSKSHRSLKSKEDYVQELIGNEEKSSLTDDNNGDIIESLPPTATDKELFEQFSDEESKSNIVMRCVDSESETQLSDDDVVLETQTDIRQENTFVKLDRELHDVDNSDLGCTENSPDDNLVQFLCNNMLPTSDCIGFHGGIESWVNKVMSALSLAYQVSQTPNILFSMRVCCELASELFVAYNLEVQLLTNLGNLLHDGFQLDAKEVFEAIYNVLEAAKQKLIKTDTCMRILSSYFVLCISADETTSVLDLLFDLIAESKIPPEFVHLFKGPILLAFNLLDKAVLSDIIVIGIKADPVASDDEIKGDSVASDDTRSLQESIEDHNQHERVLIKIDEMIKNLFLNNDVTNSVLILIIDLLQQLYCGELNKDNQRMQSVNDPEFDEKTPVSEDPVNLLYTSHKLYTEKCYGLQYIAAIAYIKAFIQDVFDKETFLSDSEEFQKIMLVFEAIISGEVENMSSVNIGDFFLKTLLKGRTLSGIAKFIAKNQDIQFIKKYKFTPSYIESSMESSPLCMYLEKNLHEEYNVIGHERFDFSSFQDKIETLLAMATKDRQACLCVFSFSINQFYLQQFTAPLDDSKRTLARYVCNKAIDSHFESKSLLFLRKLTGEENFSISELEITEEISDGQFCKLSFCVSWISICLANLQNHEHRAGWYSVFIGCMLSKEKLLLPGFLDDELKRGTHIPLDTFDEGWYVDCSCGNRMYGFGPMKRKECIVCKIAIDKWTNAVAETDTGGSGERMMNFELEQSCFGVRRLQPVTCHLLRMLTAASFIGSFEIGTKEIALEQLTGTPEIDAVQSIWTMFDSHWEQLLELMNMDDYNLMMLLHVVVSQSMDVLFNIEAPSCEDSLYSWEERFESIVSPIVATRYLVIKTQIIINDRVHGFELPGLEQRLLEVDEEKYREEDGPLEDKINNSVALFRTNEKATKQNFIAELYPRRNSFPCLSKVIQNETRFRLPVHAINILNWHLATVSVANYVMKKKECLKMSVQDFIYYKQGTDSTKSNVVLQRFDAFRNSWEVLKESLEDKELTAKMKHIHVGSPMSECLLLEENSTVKDVFNILLSIQNEFLDGAVKYANKTNALKFLFRDRDIAVIPIVQMTNMTSEDLICCNIDWDSLLSQESQCDLFYGQGKHVNYDFHNIEQAVAVAVFSGKSFIQTYDTLPRIVFLDELHMNYSSMIRDLQEAISQYPLPTEISNSIRMKKDDDPRMASELLTQLGVVMTLLKKTKGDPDTPLIEYVDSWKSLLGREFPRKSLPNPETSVKLSHVVALNELLEELCADTMKNGMKDEFRIKLDTSLQDHLNNLFKDEKLTTMLLKVLKRFSFRCVLSKTADPNQMLRRYISDDSFWPLGCISEDCVVVGEKRICLSDIIPDGLMVHHTFACLTTIETELEKRRKENIKLTSFATSFNVKTKSSPSVKTAHKKKLAKSFRKF